MEPEDFQNELRSLKAALQGSPTEAVYYLDQLIPEELANLLAALSFLKARVMEKTIRPKHIL